MYKVYKIQSAHSEHCYVGVGVNHMVRIRAHQLEIEKVVRKLKSRETIDPKTKPFYRTVAEQIYELEKKRKHSLASEHTIAWLLAECGTVEDARDMETKFIKENEPHCMNIQKKSHYYYGSLQSIKREIEYWRMTTFPDKYKIK